jgi:hypothetical protein
MVGRMVYIAALPSKNEYKSLLQQQFSIWPVGMGSSGLYLRDWGERVERF